MFRNYLKIAFRNFKRQKLFSFINILGLSAGICGSLVIYLYVSHELSYDQFHEHADRIYRVNQTFIWGDETDHQFSSTGPGVAFALNEEIPEIQATTRVHTPGDQLVSVEDEKGQLTSYDETEVFAVDSNFFDFFSFNFAKGDPTSALRNPNSVIMTAQSAQKYFGDEAELGSLLMIGEKGRQRAFKLTGVLEDLPTNSYLQFDMLLSMSSFPRVKAASWSWIWTTFVTFAMLDENASVEAVREKLPALPRKYAEQTMQRALGTTFDDYIKGGKEWNLYLQPLGDIHLHSSHVYNRLNEIGNAKIVYALIGAALFIILLSCINFMNLSTAQYLKQAKGVGIRKILGSTRQELGIQFMLEAFIFCVAALVIGGMATEVLLSYFQSVSGKMLGFENPFIMFGSLFCLLLLMALLSGAYPAIFLSAFHPLDALKGKMQSGKSGKFFRNGLLVFQFSLSMVLISCTLIVYQQLRYSAQMDLGFDKEHLISINRADWIEGDRKESFVNELNQIPEVQQASWCTAIPPSIHDGDQFSAEGNLSETFPLNFMKVDENYLNTLDIDVLFGRNFSKDFPKDAERVILNESAVKNLGWAMDESIIGKRIFYPSSQLSFEIVGVVKDFNYWSLQASIEPLAIFHIDGSKQSYSRQFVALRINPQNAQDWDKTLMAIQSKWHDFAGTEAFQYEFVDQAFAESFESERQFGQVLGIFAVLALLIAGLGLLGMIVYAIEQRLREIGIRKVIGASVWSIIGLISKDYAKLVTLAIIISIPFSSWLMHQWLLDFEYRVELTPFTFVLSGIFILVVTLSISSYHALKASQLNPVEILRDE